MKPIQAYKLAQLFAERQALAVGINEDNKREIAAANRLSEKGRQDCLVFSNNIENQLARIHEIQVLEERVMEILELKETEDGSN